MKILINHLLEPSNRISGISKYLFSLLAELLKSGQHQYVLLTSWSEECLPAALRNSCLTVVSVPFIESTPRNLLRQLWLVPQQMKQHQADAEFNCNPLGGFIGSWPKVTVTHDLYFNVSPASYKRHHRLWWQLFYPLTCRSASKIICVSQNTRNDIARYYPQFADKTVVIGEGPCLTIPGNIDSDVQKRQNFGLFVANVSPNKGADTLVRALGLLRHSGRNIDVKHVGADTQGNFARFVAAIPHGAAPVSLGYLSDGQLSELYSRARFLAFPSRYEGFGLPPLEAMRLGEDIGSETVLDRYARQIPIAVIGHHEATAAHFDTINSDDQRGAMLATEALKLAGSDAQKKKWLTDLASGKAIGTLAIAEGPQPPKPRNIRTTFGGGRLNGKKVPVTDGEAATFAIALANTGGAGDRAVSLSARGLPDNAGRVSCARPFDTEHRACALWREHARRGGASDSLGRADRCADHRQQQHRARRLARGQVGQRLRAPVGGIAVGQEREAQQFHRADRRGRTAAHAVVERDHLRHVGDRDLLAGDPGESGAEHDRDQRMEAPRRRFARAHQPRWRQAAQHQGEEDHGERLHHQLRDRHVGGARREEDHRHAQPARAQRGERTGQPDGPLQTACSTGRCSCRCSRAWIGSPTR